MDNDQFGAVTKGDADGPFESMRKRPYSLPEPPSKRQMLAHTGSFQDDPSPSQPHVTSDGGAAAGAPTSRRVPWTLRSTPLVHSIERRLIAPITDDTKHEVPVETDPSLRIRSARWDYKGIVVGMPDIMAVVTPKKHAGWEVSFKNLSFGVLNSIPLREGMNSIDVGAELDADYKLVGGHASYSGNYKNVYCCLFFIAKKQSQMPKHKIGFLNYNDAESKYEWLYEDSYLPPCFSHYTGAVYFSRSEKTIPKGTRVILAVRSISNQEVSTQELSVFYHTTSVIYPPYSEPRSNYSLITATSQCAFAHPPNAHEFNVVFTGQHNNRDLEHYGYGCIQNQNIYEVRERKDFLEPNYLSAKVDEHGGYIATLPYTDRDGDVQFVNVQIRYCGTPLQFNVKVLTGRFKVVMHKTLPDVLDDFRCIDYVQDSRWLVIILENYKNQVRFVQCNLNVKLKTVNCRIITGIKQKTRMHPHFRPSLVYNDSLDQSYLSYVDGRTGNPVLLPIEALV